MLFNLVLLAPVADVEEKFPGELREEVIAALLEFKSNAEQSGRERRAVLLSRQFLGDRPRVGYQKSSYFLQILSVISSLLKNENPVRKIHKVIRDSVSTVTYLVFYSHKKAGNGQRLMQ